MAYTTIDDPSAYFKVQLYTGNSSTNAQTFADTDTDMQPDMVYIKQRSVAGHETGIFDAVRGTSKDLNGNSNSAEGTQSGLTAFGSDGFTLGSANDFNYNNYTYVAWCWKAGGGSGSSNETGSINTTSTSVNTTSKFSISAYTGNDTAGATIGHGLGAVPHFVMVKCRSHAQHWAVYHHKNTSAPETDFLILSTDAATADSVNRWNDTAPSSTLITFGQENQINGPSYTYAAYAWSEVQGFSKFGSYTGNGNADGPFVNLGFRPAFIMTKKTDATNAWNMLDSTRDTANPLDNLLWANVTDAEDGYSSTATARYDFLSNGFKCVNGDGSAFNTSGSTYIYMAWAEAPFVNSNGVPCNAR